MKTTKTIEDAREQLSDVAKNEGIANADVIISHDFMSTKLASDEGIPVISLLHGAARTISHFYNYDKIARSPTDIYFKDREVNEIRELITEYLAESDVIVSNSKYMQSMINEYYGLDSTYIYPPVDTERFSPTDTDGDYYLSVQRLVWYKRPDVQIEAFSNLDETLKIAGDGKFSEQVAQECEKYDNIEYLGRVPDDELVDLYSGANAVIQTSMKEDFGYIPREAAACGTPSITVYEGGFKEFHDKDIDVGSSFSPDNRMIGLRQAVENFDPSEYNSQELVDLADREYSIESTMEDMNAVINEVTK